MIFEISYVTVTFKPFVPFEVFDCADVVLVDVIWYSTLNAVENPLRYFYNINY